MEALYPCRQRRVSAAALCSLGEPGVGTGPVAARCRERLQRISPVIFYTAAAHPRLFSRLPASADRTGERGVACGLSAPAVTVWQLAGHDLPVLPLVHQPSCCWPSGPSDNIVRQLLGSVKVYNSRRWSTTTINTIIFKSACVKQHFSFILNTLRTYLVNNLCGPIKVQRSSNTENFD